MAKCGSRFRVLNIKNRKNKKAFGREKWGIRQERRWDFQFRRQEDQDFSTASVVAQLIPHMSSESRSVDLTNNGMVNHNLGDVEHLPTVFHDTGQHL
jgi:hypothetical protein